MAVGFNLAFKMVKIQKYYRYDIKGNTGRVHTKSQLTPAHLPSVSSTINLHVSMENVKRQRLRGACTRAVCGLFVDAFDDSLRVVSNYRIMREWVWDLTSRPRRLILMGLLSSVLCCHVIWYTCTNVSEENLVPSFSR